MSPKEFEDFTAKLQQKGLSFNNEGDGQLGVSNQPAAKTETKEINETMSPEELKKLSNKLESVGADMDLKSLEAVPKKEEAATTAA